MMNGKEYEGKQQCDGKKRYILYRNHLLRMGLISIINTFVILLNRNTPTICAGINGIQSIYG